MVKVLKMEYHRKALSVILLLAISSFTITTVKAEPENGFVPNELIVGFKDLGRQNLLDVEKAGGDVLELIPQLKAVKVGVPSPKEGEFIAAMRGKSGVRYVEKNAIVKAVYNPEDPYWIYQWNMRIIQANYAWNIHGGSPAVKVAIIDTGLDYTHFDLDDHWVPYGRDWVNDDGDPWDDNGHGTHCAGIVAAEIDNGIGVAGVAQVSLTAEKVLGMDGSGTFDNLAQGVVHAADREGVEVISMSLGAYYNSNLMKDACQYAWDKGSIIVAAAGNDNLRRRFYPAAYETVIAVAATDSYDGKASYSNWGSWIELSAPGGDGFNPFEWVWSTYPYNSYTFMTGTSMAAPHVSGLAALVWSYEPGLTNQELREHLRKTADDLGSEGKDNYYGYGRINAYRALNELGPVDNPPECSIVDPVEGQTISGVYRVKVKATDDNLVSKVELSIDSVGYFEITTNFDGTHYFYDWDTTGVDDGSHTLDARATDAAPQTTYAPSITVTVDNEPYSTVMHVGDLDGSKKLKGKSGRWEVSVTVTIHDVNHEPVPGATVNGEWSVPELGAVSGTTNSDGTVTFKTGRMSGGSSVTFTVINVSHDELTYDGGANHDPDGDSLGTFITVNK